MSSEKYIGLDVHQATISVAVVDSQGKVVMESILETKASTLLEFFAGLRGSLFVTFEEGTSAAWLYDLLKPHVTDVLVRVLSSSELSIRLGIKTSSRAPVPWQAEHDNQPRDCAVRVEPCMSRLLYRVNTK